MSKASSIIKKCDVRSLQIKYWRVHIVLESSLSFLGKRKCWWLYVIIKVTSGHYQLHFPSKVKIYENSLQFRPLISIFSIYTIPVYNKKFLYAILFIFILFAVIIHWWLNWNHRSLPSGVDGDHSAVCATTTEIKALFLKQFKRSVSLVFFFVSCERWSNLPSYHKVTQKCQIPSNVGSKRTRDDAKLDVS